MSQWTVAWNALWVIWPPQVHRSLHWCILGNVGGARKHPTRSSVLWIGSVLGCWLMTFHKSASTYIEKRPKCFFAKLLVFSKLLLRRLKARLVFTDCASSIPQQNEVSPLQSCWFKAVKLYGGPGMQELVKWDEPLETSGWVIRLGALKENTGVIFLVFFKLVPTILLGFFVLTVDRVADFRACFSSSVFSMTHNFNQARCSMKKLWF